MAHIKATGSLQNHKSVSLYICKANPSCLFLSIYPRWKDRAQQWIRKNGPTEPISEMALVPSWHMTNRSYYVWAHPYLLISSYRKCSGETVNYRGKKVKTRWKINVGFCGYSTVESVSHDLSSVRTWRWGLNFSCWPGHSQTQTPGWVHGKYLLDNECVPNSMSSTFWLSTL